MDDPTKQPTGGAGDSGREELTGEDMDALLSGAGGGEPGADEQPAAPGSPAVQGDGGEMSAPSPPPGTGEAQPSESFELPEFGPAEGSPVDTKRISMLNDVKLNVKIELGRSRMLVEDVLKLGEGSVVELDKPAGDPVEVYVNERLVARGEVLVLNDNFCVRISEVLAADPHRVSA